MSRGAETSLALSEPQEVALHLNLHTTFKHAPKMESYAKQPTPNEKVMSSQRRTLLTVLIALAISAI